MANSLFLIEAPKSNVGSGMFEDNEDEDDMFGESAPKKEEVTKKDNKPKHKVRYFWSTFRICLPVNPCPSE